jgi:hypothetical protein
VSVTIIIDVHEWLDMLDAHAGPKGRTLEELSATLAEGFAETQALVHVITGSLRGSGRVSNKRDENSWTGEITYGGPAPGFAHPNVDYARKEFGRGENHDAMRNLDLLREKFLEAMGASVRAKESK